MPPIQPIPPDQSAVSAPSYQIPTTPAPKKSKAGLIAIIVVVVLIILAAIGAGLYFFTPLRASIQAQFPVATSIPQELQNASFLSDSAAGNTIVYMFPPSGQTSTDAGAVIVSANQSPNGSARITRSADGTFKVLIGTTVVLQDKTPRIGIDLAPDGKSVVYAEASSTVPVANASSTSSFVSPAAAPMLVLSTVGWNILVYNPTTNTTSRLGAGASPFFIDQSHVAWIARTGLAITNLSTGKSIVVVKELNIKVLNTVLISPDHTVIAWYDGSSRKLTEYKLTASTATALPVTTIATPPKGNNPIHSFSLGNDSVYLLSKSAAGTEILKQIFGQQAVHAGNIAPSFAVGRLVIGSL